MQSFIDREVFNILYRLHGKDHEGAGIGLATCKWIAQNHFGTIGVESNVDEGSSFYFTLRSI
jgi:signal transduction histidine kinase